MEHPPQTLPAVPRSGLSAALLFGVIVLAGMMLFRDYGMAWDDYLMRTEMAFPLFHFLGDPLNRPLSLGLATYHGPSLEIIETGIDRIAGLEDSRALFLFRHGFNFAVFAIGLWGLHRASARWFGNANRALLPVVLVLLQPRIFADAFYNSKDIGFLAVLCLALWTGERFREAPNRVGRLLAHAFVCGFLVGIRVIGVMVPIADFFLVLLPLALAAPRTERGAALRVTAGFTLATYLFTVLCWPTLWFEPLTGLWKAVADNARFAWKGTVLFGGRFIPADQVPWDYLPRWIVITTPLTILALALAGAFALCRRGCARDPLALRTGARLALICLPPPLVAILAGSTLYDGWRHFYYLAVPLAVCAGLGFWAAWDALGARSRFVRNAFACAVACLLGVTGVEMAVLHPYQNLYFSELMGRNWTERQARYEMDYWGLTYLESLRYVVDHDPAPRINIWANSVACAYSAALLPREDRERLQFLKQPQGSDYLITNYRWQPQGVGDLPELYSIKVYGAKVISVFKAPPATAPPRSGPLPAPPAG